MLLAVSWSHPPAWGVLTVAAFGFALSLATTVRTFFRDRRADRRTDPEQLAAWTGPHVDDCEFVQELRAKDELEPHHAHTVVIRNGGMQPVYDVVLGIAGCAGGIETEQDYMLMSVGLVPPQETISRELPCWASHHESHQVPLDVHFTDVRGVRWHRGAGGRLRRHRKWRDRLEDAVASYRIGDVVRGP
ncbi:hypothetical protein ACFXOD_11685 [Streptomyces sp. NPDC059161]|uniref:hypothetical protein n=1 Tax=Streptomyces sp. NPDC059161 TaxID=3346749 RepID=UPI0036BECFE3